MSESEDIRHIPFEDLLKQRIDLPVFRLPDGTVSKNIHQTFRKFLTDTGLITCPRTGQNRTLYSLRHTYATFRAAQRWNGYTRASNTDGHKHWHD